MRSTRMRQILVVVIRQCKQLTTEVSGNDDVFQITTSYSNSSLLCEKTDEKEALCGTLFKSMEFSIN